jgi:glucoside 3-dehydrogenase (cytochrome c) hitch-hiker subunit
MNRRDVLQLGLAVAAVPAVAGAQAAPDTWKPAVFDDHQNETVIALTDLILPATDTPGAKAAHVNRYIDLYLRDGPATERTRFLEGLSWLDGYALRTRSHPFVKCSPAEQGEMLTALDTGADAALAPGNRFFRMAKSMTVRIYYNTQAGYQEMNKGGRVPAAYGCAHTEHA